MPSTVGLMSSQMTDSGYGHQPKGDECDSCGWETDELEEVDCYARIRGLGPLSPDDQKCWAWMCKVCRSTLVGNAYQYPNQYDDKDVLRTIAWGINYLSDQIKRSVRPRSSDTGPR